MMEKMCSLCIQDRQQKEELGERERETRKMRETGEGVSQLDEKCRGGTPEGLTITPVPLCGAGGTQRARNERTSSKKKRDKKAEALGGPKEEQGDGDVSPLQYLNIYVYEGRRMGENGWATLGRQGGGLRSKDDRELYGIHIDTHIKEQMASKINSDDPHSAS